MRFFFDIRDGQDLPDDIGTELPDLDTAKQEAAQLAGRLLLDRPGEFWHTDKWQVRVRGDDGEVLLTLLVLAVPGRADRPPIALV